LPNYMNGGVAGPLLDQDPNNLCGADCMGQGGIGYDSITTKRDVTLDDPADSLPLERIYNKGPLLTIAMALFGEGSFVANRVTWPDAYSGINGTRRNAGVCVDMAPLSSLLTDRWGQTKRTFSLNRCITNGMSGHGFAGLQAELADWTDNFIDNDERTVIGMVRYGLVWRSNHTKPAAYIITGLVLPPAAAINYNLERSERDLFANRSGIASMK
ncbi:hypothetical protein B0A49_13230, partial [Cryomyces minteri]